MTLRTRLTLLVLGLLASALLLSGALLTFSVRQYAQAQAERSTVQALASVVQAGAALPTADERLGVWYGQLSATALQFGTLGAMVTPNGQTYSTSLSPSGQAQIDLPAQALAQARRRGQADLPGAKLLATAGGTILMLHIPVQEVSTLTRRVALTFAAVASITLMLAAFGAWVAVKLGLRPLRVMAQQAEAISSADAERLPIPAPRDEVRSLAESLNAMLGRLQDAFGQLSAEEARTRAFAADASHELRTPIAAISGSLEVLERAGDDPEIRARLTANLRREARRASRLVADLLTLTRLDAGEALQREAVNLPELLAGIAETARDMAPHLQIQYVAGPVFTVQADRARLEGAVWNLMRNAISATPEGGEIVLRLTPTANAVQISVLNPAQLPAEFLPRLFDRFARGPNAAAGGVGLGLAIVQATARAHGGETFAVQHPGVLEVGFTLPESHSGA